MSKLVNKLLRRKDSRLDVTVHAYRHTFTRDEYTRQVFLWLFERCGILRRIDTEDQRVLHNWGVELLENMGLTQGMNYNQFVELLLKFGIPDEAIDARASEGVRDG